MRFANSMFIKRLLYYLNPATLFKQREDGTEENSSITIMHGINRISIVIFLLCLALMFYKFVLR